MQWRPFESAPIDRYGSISEWQAEASDLIASMLERWNLRHGSAFVGGVSGAVMAVTMADGSPAVLKVGYPHVEARWEAVGLEAFGSTIAPRVLDQDAWSWAILLSQVQPGTPLSRSSLAPADALTVGAELLARVHAVPAPVGIPTLRSAMRAYSESALGRLPSQQSGLIRLGVDNLVAEAIGSLDRLAADPAGEALLHGDFNPGNVLEGSEGWRVVDPNPLVGDPAYDLWPLVSQLGHPADSRDLASLLAAQLQIAADVSGLDAERAAQWGWARAGLDVSWYLEDGALESAALAARQLRAWATVAGR